jgi:hypothetical protein
MERKQVYVSRRPIATAQTGKIEIRQLSVWFECFPHSAGLLALIGEARFLSGERVDKRLLMDRRDKGRGHCIVRPMACEEVGDRASSVANLGLVGISRPKPPPSARSNRRAAVFPCASPQSTKSRNPRSSSVNHRCSRRPVECCRPLILNFCKSGRESGYLRLVLEPVALRHLLSSSMRAAIEEALAV